MTKSESPSILAVAPDADMLLMVKAVLENKGYRVLLAGGVHVALQVLKVVKPRVASVLICAGIADCQELQNACQKLRIEVHLMPGSVEDGIVRCKLPDLAAPTPLARVHGAHSA